jgi:hypothetical protein
MIRAWFYLERLVGHPTLELEASIGLGDPTPCRLPRSFARLHRLDFTPSRNDLFGLVMFLLHVSPSFFESPEPTFYPDFLREAGQSLFF